MKEVRITCDMSEDEAVEGLRQIANQLAMIGYSLSRSNKLNGAHWERDLGFKAALLTGCSNIIHDAVHHNGVMGVCDCEGEVW